ncbi:MAG TPA: hypothetical protein VF501_00290, partial [Thiobacillus sp.]
MTSRNQSKAAVSPVSRAALTLPPTTRTRLEMPRGPTLSLYCQGLNQSSCGTDKNAALINLHLASGQIGKPGAAPLS